MALLDFDLSRLREDERDRLHSLILEKYDSSVLIATWMLRVLEEDLSGKVDLPCEGWSNETLTEASNVALYLRDALAGPTFPEEAEFCNEVLIILEEVWEDRNRVAVAS